MGRTGNVSERMQAAASRETLQELCVGLHYRRVSARTFNAALRFSERNFEMRTNVPNTRLRRGSCYESHPGDAVSSFFLYEKERKKETEEFEVGPSRKKQTSRDYRNFH